MGIAQTVLSPAVIAANGGVSRFSDIELEWTLGESVVGLTGNSGLLYTIGFHQPLLVSRQVAGTTKAKTEPGALAIQVLPNPVGNMLKIQFLTPVNKNRKFLLTDLLGNIVLDKTVSGKLTNAEIAMGHLISGIYQLRIITDNAGPAETFKIIKLK
jgi:hypothetical protein